MFKNLFKRQVKQINVTKPAVDISKPWDNYRMVSVEFQYDDTGEHYTLNLNDNAAVWEVMHNGRPFTVKRFNATKGNDLV